MIVIIKLKKAIKQMRSTIVGLLGPFLIELFHIFGGEWRVNEHLNFSTPNIIAVLITIVCIELMLYFAYKDHKENIDIEHLKTKLKNTLSTSDGVQNLVKYIYNNINKKSNDMLEKNDYSKDSLDIFHIATLICQQVYLTLSDIFVENKDNITVNMYLKVQKEKKSYCRMIAHEGTTSRPRIYLKNLSLNGKSDQKYFCQTIFIDNNPDYRILTTEDEVAEHFSLSNNSNGKYSQYIGVPLTDSNNNIVALLEINILHKDQIFDSIENARDFIRSNLIPFVSMFMLSINLDNLLDVVKNNSYEGDING